MAPRPKTSPAALRLDRPLHLGTRHPPPTTPTQHRGPNTDRGPRATRPTSPPQHHRRRTRRRRTQRPPNRHLPRPARPARPRDQTTRRHPPPLDRYSLETRPTRGRPAAHRATRLALGPHPRQAPDGLTDRQDNTPAIRATPHPHPRLRARPTPQPDGVHPPTDRPDIHPTTPRNLLKRQPPLVVKQLDSPPPHMLVIRITKLRRATRPTEPQHHVVLALHIINRPRRHPNNHSDLTLRQITRQRDDL